MTLCIVVSVVISHFLTGCWFYELEWGRWRWRWEVGRVTCRALCTWQLLYQGHVGWLMLVL